MSQALAEATTTVAQTPDVTLDTVLAQIRARRAEFEGLAHVPADMVAQLQQVGVYRAFVPKRFGGDALSPADFCRLIEKISMADASTGWVSSFGVSSTYLAALPPETFAKIYGANPNTRRKRPPAKATGCACRVAGRGAPAPWGPR